MVDMLTVVAPANFLSVAPCGAAGGLFLLLRCEGGGRPICCPRALARLRPSAVRVRIRSRSTSASPPSTAIIKRPVLVPVSAHGSASDRNCPPGIHDLLDDGEQVERRARQPVDSSHRHHVAGVKARRASAEARAGRLVRPSPSRGRSSTAASGGAQLLKLGVEGLPIGADAGIADEAVFRGLVSVISYGQTLTH